jgi:hypothetical protein
MTNQPELKGNPSPDISHLEISEEGVKKLLIAIIQSSGTEPNSYDFFVYCCYIWSDVGSTIF